MDTPNPFLEGDGSEEPANIDLFADELEEQVSNAAVGGCISTVSTVYTVCTVCTIIDPVAK